MNVVETAMGFKRAHPTNYWVRIVCFAFCVVFASLWIVDDASATTQDNYQTSTTYPESNYLVSSLEYLHAKDGHLVAAHGNEAGDLIVSWKYETTDDWNSTTVAAYDWGGLVGPWKITGVVGTSNGSIAVCAGNYDGATYLDEIYLWIHFLGDPWSVWDEEKLIDSTTNYIGGVSVNDTDQIMFAGRRGSAAGYPIYYHVFDFPNYEIDDFLSWQGKVWDASSLIKTYVDLVVNMTGAFHHVFEGNDDVNYYVAHDDGWTDRKQICSSSYNVYDAGFLNNDMLVIAGATGSTVPNYWYQTVYDGAFTKVIISTNSNTWSRGVALVLNADNNATRVVSFNTDDDELFTWSAAWNGDGTAWQNSEANADRSDPDYIRMVGSNSARWPQDPDGRQWAMPRTGWAVVIWDEDGATDDHGILWNSTTFWGNLTTDPPEITTAELPDAAYGVFYSHDLTKVNGTPPYEWSLLIAPAWMSIGPDNGTIYGTPDGTGTEQIRVNLDDVIPRGDEREWTLTIGLGSEGGDGDAGPASGICSSGWIAFCVLLLMMFVLVGVTADNSL